MRIKVPAQRKRVNGTLQDTEVSIEIEEDGVNIAATGTITFVSALKLAEALLNISLTKIVEIKD